MWIDKFFELLYSEDSTKIEKAYDLKNKKIPNFIYKYKSIKDNKHTFDLLENDLIYLAKANNLNDLYEGEFFYDVEKIYFNHFETEILNNFIKKVKLSDEEKERLSNSENPYLDLQKLIYETDPIVNTDIPFEEFSDFLLKITFDALDKVFQDGSNHIKENTYLTCFSEDFDTILMWSHYADSNMGICIKYNIKNYDDFLMRLCYPIKYEEGYDYTEELSNIKENFHKLRLDPYLRKETRWSYEKEWRILVQYDILLRCAIKIGENYFLKLPKPSAIYLGKRITDMNKEKIIDICKKREISLYQMEKDTREAKLYETEILKYS